MSFSCVAIKLSSILINHPIRVSFSKQCELGLMKFESFWVFSLPVWNSVCGGTF